MTESGRFKSAHPNFRLLEKDTPAFSVHSTRTGRFQCDKPNVSEHPRSAPRPDSVFKPEDVGVAGVHLGGKSLHGMNAAIAAKSDVVVDNFDRIPDCPLLRPVREGCTVRSWPNLQQVPRDSVIKHKTVCQDFVEKLLPGRHD